jgi:TetR/AcrR family tetracycline transcriptional repressor
VSSLSRNQIIDAARDILEHKGLGGLTMRRLAVRLEVQPGALYYHVASKQDLLVGVAERILNDSGTAISADDPAQAVADIRTALLPIRDSADVVSFVNAFRPGVLVPFSALEQLFRERLPAQQARWAAQTLIHYVLGFVAQEQNQAELVQARIVPETADQDAADEAFRFGVTSILRGLPGGSRDADCFDYPEPRPNRAPDLASE